MTSADKTRQCNVVDGYYNSFNNMVAAPTMTSCQETVHKRKSNGLRVQKDIINALWYIKERRSLLSFKYSYFNVAYYLKSKVEQIFALVIS